jgi:hypothetical protein
MDDVPAWQTLNWRHYNPSHSGSMRIGFRVVRSLDD